MLADNHHQLRIPLFFCLFVAITDSKNLFVHVFFFVTNQIDGQSNGIEWEEDSPPWWCDIIFSLWVVSIHVYYSYKFTDYSLDHVHREIEQRNFDQSKQKQIRPMPNYSVRSLGNDDINNNNPTSKATPGGNVTKGYIDRHHTSGNTTMGNTTTGNINLSTNTIISTTTTTNGSNEPPLSTVPSSSHTITTTVTTAATGGNYNASGAISPRLRGATTQSSVPAGKTHLQSDGSYGRATVALGAISSPPNALSPQSSRNGSGQIKISSVSSHSLMSVSSASAASNASNASPGSGASGAGDGSNGNGNGRQAAQSIQMVEPSPGRASTLSGHGTATVNSLLEDVETLYDNPEEILTKVRNASAKETTTGHQHTSTDSQSIRQEILTQIQTEMELDQKDTNKNTDISVKYATLARPLTGLPNTKFCCLIKWSPRLFTWTRTNYIRLFLRVWMLASSCLAVVLWIEFFLNALLEV